MPKCSGYKRDGTPCSLSARGDGAYCWAHSPEHAEERSQNAAKAGRAKGPGGEIVEVKRRIREVAEGVLDGSIDKGRGSVAFQGFGVLIRAIEVERKIKETQEFEERLKDLEATQERGGSRWGA
jgi:hypothetical protein